MSIVAEPTDLMMSLAEQLTEELGLKDKDIALIQSEWHEYLDPDNYQRIELCYYGEPKAQPRARATSNLSHFYDPGKSFKLFINESIRAQLGNDFKPISKEIYFTARFYRPTPKGAPKKTAVLMELGIIRPLVKPDLDNYEKLLYDSLLHLLYKDDSVITKGNHEKFYSCKPRVEIEILFRK
jgi:Holliday junction resolvase RusA-like endonuclease